MKVLVTYFSQSGNTKKVAEAIYNEISGDKEIMELKDLEHLEGYDFSFIGFPLHSFGPAEQAKKFLGEHTAGKKLALFITHATPEDHEELQPWLEKCREAAVDADILGMFDCQGELAQGIMEFLLKSDDPKLRAFGEHGSETKGQPDEARLKRAREFARQMIEKL